MHVLHLLVHVIRSIVHSIIYLFSFGLSAVDCLAMSLPGCLLAASCCFDALSYASSHMYRFGSADCLAMSLPGCLRAASCRCDALSFVYFHMCCFGSVCCRLRDGAAA